MRWRSVEPARGSEKTKSGRTLMPASRPRGSSRGRPAATAARRRRAEPPQVGSVQSACPDLSAVGAARELHPAVDDVTEPPGAHRAVALPDHVVLAPEPVAAVQALEEAAALGRRDAGVVCAEDAHGGRDIPEGGALVEKAQVEIPIHHPAHAGVDRIGAERRASDDARDGADVATVGAQDEGRETVLWQKARQPPLAVGRACPRRRRQLRSGRRPSRAPRGRRARRTRPR